MNSTCPAELKSENLESASDNQASNFQHCITDASSSATYCVYTFPKFAQGRGLSMIASPSIAPYVRDAMLRFPPSENIDNNGLFYEMSLPGRGIGLISNHTFQKGDSILTTTPLFMVQESAMSDLVEADRYRLQQLSISSLPPQSSELYHSLAGHFGGDKIEDVVLTNAFSARLGDVKEGFGIVVPEAARLNHDCRPNARFAFDPRTLSHKVHATRIIKPGEELTFSYIDEKQTHAARQQQLQANWGFKCGCTLCSASPDVRISSDTRLQRIAVLRKSLLPFRIENSANITPEMVLEFVSLYETEGLDGAMAEAYMVTALWYCVWGNAEETSKWAALAIKNWEAGGKANLQQMKSLNRRPQDHWCWSSRG
ncbi:hypothetical protein VTL71DRAFT_2876 [Oculimacula yallundae]|uniref:SET domain-containing protein n=1 Tax=Oculimacula yallundae TaxID=86028 RepID=A0ABR4C6R8_9HELO